MYKNFICKKNVNVNDFLYISTNLLLIFTHLCLYAEQNGLPVIVTSIMDSAEGRIFKTHSDGRAMDISIAQWPIRFVKRMQREFNRKFLSIAAISMADKKPRAVVVHDAGTGSHLHIQVRS